MLLSKLIGERFKETPTEANCKSHALLIKGGYIKQVGSGLYTLTPLARKITLKIENIIREEMNAIDGQECLFPVMMPRSLWEESGRYSSIGSEMFRLQDRNLKDMVLGMTHEEAAVHLVRSENDSYKHYPYMVYQIQTKLRDEPRPRAGIIRVREFTMKDAYSFHTNQKCLEDYYEKAYQAYNKIYARCGLKNFAGVKGDNGMMGGKISHEFMSINEAGEDKLIICEKCGFASNQEVATTLVKPVTKIKAALKEVKTPDIKTIEDVSKFLSVEKTNLCKAVVYGHGKDNAVVVFIRGDREVNETKLRNFIKAEVYPLEDLSGHKIVAGFIGPIGLKETAKLKILFDNSIKNEQNLVIGANKKDYHITGFCPERDYKDAIYGDFNKAVAGDVCECGAQYVEKQGVEIGNIFQLGTRYSSAMNMTYLDENGKKQTPIMGCYGIGVGRILACLVEEFGDNYGPIWPKAVAPYSVHICVVGNDDKMKNEALKTYQDLKNRGIDVILDDRNLSAGITFADADLLGVPTRIVFGAKSFANGEVEISSRDKTIKRQVKIADVLKNVIELAEISYLR